MSTPRRQGDEPAGPWVFDLEVGLRTWRVRGPDGEPREGPDPTRNRRVSAWLASWRDQSTHRLPEVGASDPLARHAALAAAARELGTILTETLCSTADLGILADAMQAGRVRLTVRARAAGGATDAAADAALALPWELLMPRQDGDYPARLGDLEVVREAWCSHSPDLPAASGPLHLAVSVAAPEDRDPFAYEEESFRLLSVLSPLGQQVSFTNLGTLEDLEDLVAGVQATAVHFCGHAHRDGLSFEDPLGFAVDVPMAELRRRLATILLDPRRADAFPGLCFLGAPSVSGRRGRPASAATLHRSGFTQVIGYFGASDHPIRSRCEARFYDALAAGASTLDAAAAARAVLVEPMGPPGDRAHFPFAWCWLHLYHRGVDRPLARPESGPPRPSASRQRIAVRGLPVLAHGFIGRRGLQHEIRRRIEHDGQRLIVLQGLGGLGKTALASQLLVSALAPDVEDRLVLRCQDLERSPLLELRAQAEDHGRFCGLPFWQQRVDELRRRVPDPAEGLVEVLRSIRRDRPRLVVYVDNLESLQIGPASNDPSALGTWRPGVEAWWNHVAAFGAEDECLILATTRYAWHRLDPRAHVGLTAMEASDSLRLIQTFDALAELPTAVRRRLARQVDGHPRTIELLDGLVARHLATHPDIEDPWRDGVAPVLPDQTQQIRADLLVAELWDRLTAGAQEHLSRLMAMRRPAQVQVVEQLGAARDELIRSGLLTRYRDHVLGLGETFWIDLWGLHAATREALDGLVDASEIERGHRLAAEAFRRETENEVVLFTDYSEAVYHACHIRRADAVWPIAESHVLTLRDRAQTTEALEILEQCEAAGVSGDQRAKALTLLAQSRSSLGARGDALLSLLDRAAEVAESAESRSAILQERADALCELGRFAEAEEQLRQALDIDEVAVGCDHPSYCASLFALASVLDEQGRYREAETLLRQTRERLLAAFGPGHSHESSLHHAIGGILERLGRYGEAEAEIRRAIDGIPETHPGRAASLNTLSQILYHQDRFSEAEDALRQALVILEQAYGERHPDIAALLRGLAGQLAAQGRFDEAERQLQRALELTLETVGEGSPSHPLTLQATAMIFNEQGRYRDAEALLQQALRLQQTTLGDVHPDLVATLHTLGTVLDHQSRLDEADAAFGRAQRVVEQVLGPDHPSNITFLVARSRIAVEREELDAAETMLRRALAIGESAHGPDSPPTSVCHYVLAQVFEDQGRLAQAEQHIRQSLRLDEQALGRRHPSTAASLHQLALILNQQEALPEALEVLRQAIDLKIALYGEANPEVFCARTNEARFLIELSELEQAEAVAASVLEAAEQADETAPNDVAQALSTLAEAQFLLGRDDALVTARRALDHLRASFDVDHPVFRSLAPDLLYFLDEDGEGDRPPPTDEELDQLHAAVATLRQAGPERTAELRDALDDLSDAYQCAERWAEAAAFMEEVVAIDRAIDHRELASSEMLLVDLTTMAAAETPSDRDAD